MNSTTPAISSEIKDFSNILLLENFKDNNPVNSNNIEAVLFKYHVPEWVHCCNQEKEEAGLCNQKHHHGYVVRLLDGTLSILGKDCAENKYDAEGQVRQKINKLNNKIILEQRIGALAEYVSDEEEIISKIQFYSEELASNLQVINDLLSGIGSINFKILESMAKSRKKTITVEFVDYKVIDGNKEDIHHFKKNIGVLNGLELITANYKDYQRYFSVKIQFLQKAKNLSEQKKPDLEIINKCFYALKDIKTDFKKIEELIKSRSLFLSNDLSLFIYLNNRMEEREKAAKFLLERNFIKTDIRSFIKSKDKEQLAIAGAKRLIIY